MSLRSALHGAPAPASDPALAGRALAAGRALEARRRTRRRLVRGTAGVVSVTAALVAYATVTAPAPPAHAAISCYDTGVVVGRASVDAGRAGARLYVTNATGSVVPLVVGDVAALVPPGRSAVDVPLRPGRVTVTCGSAGAAALTVTDSRDRYVGEDVDCASPRVEDLRATSEAATGDPVALTRAALAAPRSAVVEPAGYPGAADRRLVRVVHGDRVMAVAVWRALPGADTWTLDEVRRCGSLAFA